MLPGTGDTIVGGLRTLRELLLLGFVVAFITVYGDFMWDIWNAEEGRPPSFNDGLIAFAGSLAGVLGSAFALALGVAKPTTTEAEGRLSSIKNTFAGISPSVTIGIWAFALVGAGAAATAIIKIDETPDVVKALSSVFVGYILALASTAFRALRPV